MYARTQPANLDKGGSLSIQSELKKKKQEGLIIESPRQTISTYINRFHFTVWSFTMSAKKASCTALRGGRFGGTKATPPSLPPQAQWPEAWHWRNPTHFFENVWCFFHGYGRLWMVWFANFWIVLGSRICTFAGPNPWGKSQTHSWAPISSWGRYIYICVFYVLHVSKITWYSQVQPNFRHLWSWPCTRHSRDDFGCWTSKIGCQLFHTDPCSIGVKVLVTKKLDLYHWVSMGLDKFRI